MNRFSSIEWWKKNVKQGDLVVLLRKGFFNPKTKSSNSFRSELVFDCIRTFNDLMPETYFVFQEKTDDIGNKGNAIPVRPEEIIDIESIAGKEVRHNARRQN